MDDTRPPRCLSLIGIPIFAIKWKLSDIFKLWFLSNEAEMGLIYPRLIILSLVLMRTMKLLFLFRQSVLAKRLLKYTAINWTRIGFCLQCYYSVVINIIIIVLVVGLECHLTQRRNNINITIMSLFMCLSSSPHIRLIHKISLRDCVVFCGRQQIFHMNILVPL